MITFEELQRMRLDIRMMEIEHSHIYWKNPFDKKLPELRTKLKRLNKKFKEAMAESYSQNDVRSINH